MSHQNDTGKSDITEFSISLNNEDDISNINKNNNESEINKITQPSLNIITKLCKGVLKTKDEKKKEVAYLISANGDFFLNRKILTLILIAFLLSLYMGWILVIQIVFVVSVIGFKKIFDDKRQKVVFSLGKIIFKKNNEVDLKSISKILVADLKSKTIIEEKHLSYHWMVESLMLEDVGNSKMVEGSIIEESSMNRIKGRYSILLRVEDKDIEILRGLSRRQVDVIMKELVD